MKTYKAIVKNKETGERTIIKSDYNSKKEVEKFIDNNFNIEDFKIKDMKIFPAGKVLTDKNGDSVLIFYDIQNEKIVYEVI